MSEIPNCSNNSDCIYASFANPRNLHLKQRRRETGSIAPREQTKFRGRALAGLVDRLAALIAAQPDATLAELRDALPTSAALSTLWRAIDQLQLTVKRTSRRGGRRTTTRRETPC